VNEFDVLGAAAAGMDAQRAALNVAARNVAASEAGGSFARLVPQFAIAEPEVAPEPDDDDDAVSDANDPEANALGDPGVGLGLVRFVGASPEHGSSPDAIAEMVAVLNAERAYEANASVFEAGKRLAERTIDAGRS
jgi:hypothetical protein